MICRVMLFAVLLAGSLLAQPPRGFFPWWDRPVAKDLNLTVPQMRQIRMTVREYRDKLIEYRAAVEKAEAGLQDVLKTIRWIPRKPTRQWKTWPMPARTSPAHSRRCR